MKKYIVPELEIIKINADDVITTSVAIGEPGKNETGFMGAGNRNDDFWGKNN